MIRRRCQLEAAESGELELMDSKMHIIQLSVNYSLELSGLLLKLCLSYFFSEEIFKHQRKYILSHVTMGAAPTLDYNAFFPLKNNFPLNLWFKRNLIENAKSLHDLIHICNKND